MFYLAAAVSDFYIPTSEMPEHKIQSSNGPLQVSVASQKCGNSHFGCIVFFQLSKPTNFSTGVAKANARYLLHFFISVLSHIDKC